MLPPKTARLVRRARLCAMLCAAPSLAPSPARSEPAREELRVPERVASYSMRARLDEASHTIHGQGSIHWVNSSLASTDELYFHLYLNAFKNAETLFNRSPFTRARSGRLPRSFGQLNLERLSARELPGVDLLAAMEAHSPGDPRDETDRRVQLPRPVAPGESLTLDVAWSAVLPEILERTGYSRDFYFAGQWFPKLARLEPDGTWAHFAFHPHAEFYADFGDYDVTLDVPKAMIVGATGRRESEVTDGARRYVRQQAQNVHDFAWTAWRGFEQLDERVHQTHVHLLYPPGHARNAAVTLETLRFALPYFDAHYGPYPYPDLTVVHPPAHAGAVGGMEYPTLITTGGAWHQSYWSRAVEVVTLHELAHQWFYGLIATHEARWPFLDEGLTSYAESRAAAARFGASSASDWLGFELSADAVRRATMLLGPHAAPLALPASEFVTFEELGAVVYSKTALLLTTIANVYGEAELDTALRLYAERYRFRHPGPEDLLQILGAELGAEAAANLSAAIFEGAGVNYLVRDLRSAQVLEPGGPGRANADPATAPERAPLSVASRVDVHRQGELRFPVDLLLITATGEHLMQRLDADGRVEVASHLGQAAVVSALVDPARKIVVEESLLDNAASQNPAAPVNTWDRALYVFQLLVGWLAP